MSTKTETEKRRIVEVKVVAEYWANIELDDSEVNYSEDKIKEMAWQEFYDTAHMASIESVDIEDDKLICAECDEENVYPSHECAEESDDEDDSDIYTIKDDETEEE